MGRRKAARGQHHHHADGEEPAALARPRSGPQAARSLAHAADRPALAEAPGPGGLSEHRRFGPGLYGAEAAARAFFGKPAADLSRHEAARLAAVLPNPLGWSADAPGPHLRQRAALIERRVAQIQPLLACAR
nr:transglycosylase domain-containing protein [Siccirubricoccus sp. G192]